MTGMYKCCVRLLTVLIWLSPPMVLAADPAQDMMQAERLILSGDLITGMQKLRVLAEAGYAPAQARIGEILDRAEDNKQAVEWYRKAAQQGNAAGEFGLGVAYANGEGVAVDLQQAQSWIKRAADKDYLRAVQAMAGAYRTGGLGLPADPAQAAYWSAKAKALEARLPSPTPQATSNESK